MSTSNSAIQVIQRYTYQLLCCLPVLSAKVILKRITKVL